MPILRPVNCTLVALLLTSCANYVEPKPGIYLGVNKPSPDLMCEYETPTATRFTSLQCRKPEDMAESERRAKEMLDNQRIYQPRDP